MDPTDLFRNIITAKLQAQELFTAYDVTKAAQSSGLKDRHKNVRHITHEFFASGDMPGYTRTLVKLGNGEDAFVFHPDGSDPTTYQSKQTAVAAGATQPQMAQAPTTIPTRAAHKRGSGGLDIDGRFNIPAKLLREIGVKPHDMVFIMASKDSNMGDILLITTAPPGGKYEQVCVTAKNNVRLSPRILHSVGFKGSTFKATKLNSDNIIVVSPV